LSKETDPFSRCRDRSAICDLLASYVSVIDNARYSDLPELFAPGGELRSLITGRTTPRSQLSDYLRAVVTTRVKPSWRAVRHHLSMPAIELGDDETATSVTYFTAFNAEAPDHWGAYRDRLVKIEGAWRFQERVVEVLGSEPSGWVGSGGADLR
jgi:hypothetical protein